MADKIPTLDELMRGKVRVPKTACPHCHVEMDGASCTTEPGITPSEGDVGLCINCGKWSGFDSEMRRRPLDEKTMSAIAIDPRCQRAQQAWALMDAQRSKLSSLYVLRRPT